MNKKFIVVGVSGSLRRESLNTLYLQALQLACPERIEFKIYQDLASIPPFNVDLDAKPPEPVQHWKSFLGQADMVVLATPEYAHGISGVLKNALDWLVSDFQLLDCPLAFPNISIRATIAQTNMEEILRTMGFMLVESCSPSASIEKPLVHLELSPEEMVNHPVLGAQFSSFWQAVETYLHENDSSQRRCNSYS